MGENLEITHLGFVDNLMVFKYGTTRSVEGIIAVFEEFAKISGLSISMEKSTLFLAIIKDNVWYDMVTRFPFATEKLPVRYPGYETHDECGLYAYLGEDSGTYWLLENSFSFVCGKGAAHKLCVGKHQKLLVSNFPTPKRMYSRG